MDQAADPYRFRRIHAAFCDGDLEALRAAVEDPAVIPNGPMPLSIGRCLEYAIYHSPLAFVRELLEVGAEPNPDHDDGFPPLIAALTCTQAHSGAPARADVLEILALLLANGADPNGRGINDYTPLHVAVQEQSEAAIELLLKAGADPRLRTRIDECETPAEMARQLGHETVAERLDAWEPGS